MVKARRSAKALIRLVDGMMVFVAPSSAPTGLLVVVLCLSSYGVGDILRSVG